MSAPVSSAYLDYFRVVTLPRGSKRHETQIALCREVSDCASSGQIDMARSIFENAIKRGVFKVDENLPSQIWREKVRVNIVYSNCARRTIEYWESQRKNLL